MPSSMLAKGQNVALPNDVASLDVLITWGDADLDLDASALLLGADDRVRGDADFVFYNQPESADASVRYLGKSITEEGQQERLSIDLAAIPDDVMKVVIAGSSGERALGECGKLALQVQDGTGAVLGEFLTADATSKRAFVFGEIYRRSGVWKLRAVGQGWASGLAGLATDYGVDVDDADTGEVADEVVVAQRTAANTHVTDADGADVEVGLKVERPKRGVRTKKPVPKKVAVPELILAGGEGWQPARLFSISGVGTGEEQEKRATSSLLATMQAVRPFARAICARAGAPAGLFEGYLEVPFVKGEGKVIPDGVLRVARAGHTWTALLEVKTGSGRLHKEQLENYLDVAKRLKYEVVLSISNDIPASVGEVPVQVNRQKLTKVALRHISWSEVIHEARMTLAHGAITDPLQSWILSEFIRYLTHPKSGATEFVDMGRHWVAVRDSVSAGTLRAGDAKATSVATTWLALSRHLAMRFTAALGVVVKQQLPRRLANDPESRNQYIVERLATSGLLEATLRIPDTAGDLVVEADLRTNKVQSRARIIAPTEGTALRRVTWLLRQLKDAPADLLVEAVFTDASQVSCEKLSTVRDDAKSLIVGRQGDITSFTLTSVVPMGSRRSGSAAGFIASVTESADKFYASVLQPLKPWVPAAPEPIARPDSGPSDVSNGL
ncbi:TerD family protein [Antrihabitans sp. YC3-6]|uniref:TerD family protein n=1 Tax=Antrihabitans stalagmiti TaxID=2799499 RepID=A0A934NVD1_9NOCA|nr:TerD family protein [Antrihabitans stalagmiti]MBJ8341980.1 TerD family protein [Antrihabitans stalagmiti]